MPADCALRSRMGGSMTCEIGFATVGYPDDARTCDEGNCVDVGDTVFFYGCS